MSLPNYQNRLLFPQEMRRLGATFQKGSGAFNLASNSFAYLQIFGRSGDRPSLDFTRPNFKRFFSHF